MNIQQLYIEALIEKLKPFGDVLEVGFDKGIAAEFIQSYKPTTHTIIESNPELAKAARNFASKYSDVLVIENSWQDALSNLSCFDTVFFNQSDPTLVSVCPKESNLLLKQAEELLASVHGRFPEIKTLCYSDKDLQDLYCQEGHLKPKEFSRFLLELQERKQISKDQYEGVLKQYNLEAPEQKKKVFEDTALVFLRACLQKHLKKGSRFSCVSSFPISKYEDPLFFDQVITNPHFDYEESFIAVEPSDEYRFKEALIMVLNKVC